MQNDIKTIAFNFIKTLQHRNSLAVPLGSIPVGGEMKAHFAHFYEFKDGKIFKQRNYDCFEPFS